LDSIEYDDAVIEAVAWVGRLRAVTDFVPAGRLTGPHRMVVETSLEGRIAPREPWVLVDAAEASQRIGVPEQDLPQPFLNLPCGRVYRLDKLIAEADREHGSSADPR
jgi:hypothetical protein